MKIDRENCTACGGCAALCPVSAIEVENSHAEIQSHCIRCKNCADFCPVSAITQE